MSEPTPTEREQPQRRRRLRLSRQTALPVLGLSMGVLLLAHAPVSLTNTTAFASGTSVRQIQAIFGYNEIKPDECVSVDIKSRAADPTSGTLITGDADNNLILGNPLFTGYQGGDGDDCMTGPTDGVTYAMDGGNGTDVCLGNATTTFSNCETKYRNGIEDTSP